MSTAPVRCGVCSLGCPSCLVLLLTLFVLHQLLRWGGLVTGLWPLLLLLCVGLLWGLCCAVLSPWALARPTLSGLRLRIPMVSWAMLLVFSWTLSWGSFLSLPVVMDGLGWLLPALRAGSPTYGWRCVLRRALVLVAVPHSHRLVLRIRTGFLFYGPGVRVGFNCLLLLCIPSGCGHPLGQERLFVTLDRERRFTILVVPFRFRLPILGAGRGIPLSPFGLSPLMVAGDRALAWLVAELCRWAVFSWPHLLLSYGPSGCWLAVHVVVCPLFVGPTVSWPSCLSFALLLALVLRFPVGSLLPYGSHPSRWGHPCGVEALLSSIGTKVRVFPFPFWAVSSCCHCPWGFGHHMGLCVGRFQLMRARRFLLVLRIFSFWMGFVPLSEAPLCALSLRGGFLVVLAEEESLRLSLDLSSVLPCPMF